MDVRGKRLLAMTEGLPETCLYRAIVGTASNDVWLAGEDGCIAHFDGAKWTAAPSRFSERLNGVWAASRDHAWAVGVGGLLLEWDGRTWHQQQSDTHQNLHAISGTSEQDVWIVGEAGMVLHHSGESR